MSFVGRTTEREIHAAKGKTFKIFLTEQVGGFWVATVLYANDGLVTTHVETAATKVDAYRKASAWTLSDIDPKASIDPL
jgi:hypothetical protein